LKVTGSNRIAYVQYTNPAAYPPLEHSASILADSGWDVLFLGSGSSGQADSFQFQAHPHIRVRRWHYVRRGWRQKAHFSAFSLWVLWQCWRNRSAWIYASDLLACPAALLASRVLGCRVVYHEHDSPPMDGSPFFHRLLASRAQLCQRAAAVVLPNAQRAEVFSAGVQPASPVLTVWNCPQRCEVPVLRQPSEAAGTLFYHGSLNAQRLPVSVVEALAQLPAGVRLEFAGYTTEGSRSHVQTLLQEADRLGLTARVRYAGAPATRAALLEACAQANIGLSFMPLTHTDLNMQAMVGASNKPFDYMACGLNLLVSDLPDWCAMFVKPGYARACNPADATSIAQAVRWLLDHPAEANTARVQGRQRILEDWNYETQFAPVLRVLTNPPPA
jgi:glycosyltransferase involved in cell wall biosynthesis